MKLSTILLMLGIIASTVLFISCKKDEEKDTPTGNPTGEFTDSRDSQVYKWVKIGEQTWMAENLNPTCSYPERIFCLSMNWQWLSSDLCTTDFRLTKGAYL